MGANSGIEWTDDTWNPIVGCSVVSPGCTNCYAMRQAARLEKMLPDRQIRGVGDSLPNHYEGMTRVVNGKPVWTGKVALAPDHILTRPIGQKRPRKIFVNSMSDLFHESVPDAWIDRVFAVMALSPWHTFQVLTKRAKRMREYMTALPKRRREWACDAQLDDVKLPLPNVWLGVSAERQQEADERVPDLLATPAAVRFVSAEPLLGGIDFLHIGGDNYLNSLSSTCGPNLDQIIVGGESGPGARPLWVPNVRVIVEQCRAGRVAAFVKQLGSHVRDRNDAGFLGDEPDQWPNMDPEDIKHDLGRTRDGYQGAPVRVHLRDRKGGDMAEWPEDLRVREFPRVGVEHNAMPRIGT